MYLHRHIEKNLRELAQYFKIVLVKGARQTGKSTMLAHAFPNLKHIVFDPVQDMYGARKDPDLFLDNFPPPLILDEIQYAPELLPALKRRVDQRPEKGQYFLTGSQNLSVLKNVAESLAGRVGILQLPPLSAFELTQNFNSWITQYLISPEELPRSFSGTLPHTKTLYEYLWRGGFPGILELPDHLLPDYFSAYLQTYVERDIRLIENIQDLNLFERFLGIVSMLSGQEINYSQLGREIGISHPTATRWLNLLTHSYQWHEIGPYHGNTIKRISKKSKGYITDTGFACYLQRISSKDALAQNPALGAIFETYCINMIIQSLNGTSVKPHFYHWRSQASAEVDLILEMDGALYPIEIKCKTVLSKHDARGILAFRESYPRQKIQPGLILYPGKTCYNVHESVIALPWDAVVK
jgi:predicted AAA+ superfamily ATPase